MVKKTRSKTAKGPVRKKSNKTSPASSVVSATEQIRELAVANRILFKHGVVDAFGHVSVRSAKNPSSFFLARNMAPGNVTPADVVELDFDGNPIRPTKHKLYLERFIHAEIFRVRPDVMSVVHSHSPAVIPFGVVNSVQLKPIFHMSGFLGEGCPTFEIRKAVGSDSDLLIRSRELGAALAADLGVHSAILMRGHGATIAADSLRRAVYRAIYMQVNAELQTTAAGLGEINFLTSEEAKSASTTVEGQLDRAWNLWSSQV
jgi:ribulose-5-phosphate 4-epimerase/fuculose-1-phosphate aldolase